MQKESQTYKIAPAERLASVSEYYFSKKLKEVAQMNAEGKDVISLGIGSPDMPPSKVTIETTLFLTEHLADYVLTPDLSSPQETAIDHLRFMTDDQIGRASCRERV